MRLALGRAAALGAAVLGLAMVETAPARPAAGSPAALAVDLDGTLVSALAAGGDLWLLVRPVGQPDAPRRLLRLGGAADLTPRTVATDVPGWTKTLAAMDLGSGPELLVGGLGEIGTLGALAAPTASPRQVLAAADVDLRSLAPQPLRRGVEPWLAVASAGRTRVFTGRDGGLHAVFAARLPIAIAPAGGSLRLASPPGAAFDRGEGRLPLLVFGPEARGRTRLRTTILDPEAATAPRPASAATREAWSQLPGPERVEDHRVLQLDGEPYLMVRTQGSETINALERQRLRLLPLAADPTRAGARPTFAAEVDSRRWHAAEFAAGDLDRDGVDDLFVVRPEGYRGTSVVVEVYAGRAGGRFAAAPRRSDLDGPLAAVRLEEPAAAGEPPVLVSVRDGRLEVRHFRAAGRLFAGVPAVAVRLPGAATVAEGKDGRRGRAAAGVEPGFAILGLVDLGAAGRVAAAVETAPDGGQRLYLVPVAGSPASASGGAGPAAAATPGGEARERR